MRDRRARPDLHSLSHPQPPSACAHSTAVEVGFSPPDERKPNLPKGSSDAVDKEAGKVGDGVAGSTVGGHEELLRHPLEGASLPQAVSTFTRSLRFWLVVTAGVGYTIVDQALSSYGAIYAHMYFGVPSGEAAAVRLLSGSISLLRD